jgi:hypothetical protein
MGAPYSLDLRERVVAAVASGMSREAVAERFQISLSSTNRWVQRAAATGSAAALALVQTESMVEPRDQAVAFLYAASTAFQISGAVLSLSRSLERSNWRL